MVPWMRLGLPCNRARHFDPRAPPRARDFVYVFDYYSEFWFVILVQVLRTACLLSTQCGESFFITILAFLHTPRYVNRYL